MSSDQQQNSAAEGRGEDEPLLGRAGDASQQDGNGVQYNFILGMMLPALTPRPC